MFPFERLEVWSLAHALAVELFRVTVPWREWELKSQLRRCSASVAANIAEGAGAASQPLFSRFIGIAQGSATELRYHLLYARDVGLLAPERYKELDARAQRVRRMLVGLQTALRRNNAGTP